MSEQPDAATQAAGQGKKEEEEEGEEQEEEDKEDEEHTKAEIGTPTSASSSAASGDTGTVLDPFWRLSLIAFQLTDKVAEKEAKDSHASDPSQTG